MVRSSRGIPSTQIHHRVPAWLSALRHTANAAFGELEIGIRRAIDDLSVSISREADPEQGAPLDLMQSASERFLAAVQPLLVSVSAAMIAALDQIAAEIGEGASVLRERLVREVSWALERVSEYLAGFVAGGGIALVILTSLPPDLACHTGEVSAIVSENLMFLPRRVEKVVDEWITMAHRDIDGWLLVMGSSRQGVVPSSAQTDQEPPQDERRIARRAVLLEVAAELKVKIKDLPDLPSARYLERLQDKLIAVARAKGRPLPQGLVTGEQASTMPIPDSSALDTAVSLRSPPPGVASNRPRPVASPVAQWLVSGGQEWRIDETGVTIGRGRTCLVQVRDDAGISRHHATLRLVAGGVLLVDHDSTKGTLVNGVRISGELLLAGGEALQMSETRFTVRSRPKGQAG